MFSAFRLGQCLWLQSSHRQGVNKGAGHVPVDCVRELEFEFHKVFTRHKASFFFGFFFPPTYKVYRPSLVCSGEVRPGHGSPAGPRDLTAKLSLLLPCLWEHPVGTASSRSSRNVGSLPSFSRCFLRAPVCGGRMCTNPTDFEAGGPSLGCPLPTPKAALHPLSQGAQSQVSPVTLFVPGASVRQPAPPPSLLPKPHPRRPACPGSLNGRLPPPQTLVWLQPPPLWLPAAVSSGTSLCSQGRVVHSAASTSDVQLLSKRGTFHGVRRGILSTRVAGRGGGASSWGR